MTSRRLNLAVFVTIALIGGGNPVGVKVAVDELDPLWAGGTRFVAAGAVFALAMAIGRLRIPHGAALVGALAYGAFGFFGAFALLFWGFQDVPPATGQFIIALVPLFTVIFTVAHRLERLDLRALGGLAIAVAGLVFLFADRLAADVPLLSLVAVVGGAACLAESAVVLKLSPRMHPVTSNAVAMLGGGLALLVASAVVGEAWIAPTQADTWAAMIFLVLAGSVAVFGLFVYLLGRWTASAASYILLIQPLPTLLYSAVLTGEPITPAFFVGGAVMLLGVYIGALRSASQPRSEVASAVEA